MVLSSYGATTIRSSRLYAFEIPVIKLLPYPWASYYPILQTLDDAPDPCRNQFREESGIRTDADFKYIDERIRILQRPHSETRLYWFSVGVCVMGLILFCASIVETFVSVFQRSTAILDEDARIWSSNNKSNRSLRGVFQDDEAIEFFSRFIEFIPCTLDIVELPTQRTLQPSRRMVMAGWREVNYCYICLEVMLEDIGRLHGCRDSFHRRCMFLCRNSKKHINY